MDLTALWSGWRKYYRNTPLLPQYVEFESFGIASDESMTGGGKAELYWLVDDAGAAYQQMSGAAELTMELKEMPFGPRFFPSRIRKAGLATQV